MFRSGEPLPVIWSTLCVVTWIGSCVYSTGATTSSVGLTIIPSGLLLVDHLLEGSTKTWNGTELTQQSFFVAETKVRPFSD